MGTKEDLKNLLVQFHDFWPNFKVTYEDLQKGNCDFIVRFYTDFLNEVNEKIAYLINEDMSDGEFVVDTSKFDPIVNLYQKVSRLIMKILNKLNYGTLYLSDFFISSPKRILVHVKVSMHFVIYLNNFLDELVMIVGELSELQNMRILKEELRQEIADNATILGHNADVLEVLQKRLAEVDASYQQMRRDKVENDKALAEQQKELERLQMECLHADYDVQLCDEQEANLQEGIVGEEEFEALKNVAKSLEVEQARLLNKLNNHGDDKFEHTKQLEECAKTLQDLNFEHLHIVTAYDLQEENKAQEKLGVQLKHKLDGHLTFKAKLEPEVGKEEDDYKRLQSAFNEFQEVMLAELDQEKADYEKKLGQCTSNFEKGQLLKSEILETKTEIEEIERDKKDLLKVVAKEYARILTADREFSVTFHNWLSKLNDRCSFR